MLLSVAYTIQHCERRRLSFFTCLICVCLPECLVSLCAMGKLKSKIVALPRDIIRGLLKTILRSLIVLHI